MHDEDDGAPRVGRAGRAVAVGARARRVGPLLLVASLLLGLLTLWQWSQEADLRRLDRLDRASGVVEDRDRGRRSAPDHLEVRFRPAGAEPLTVRVPSSLLVREGEPVEVAYLPSDPTRARTVDGWSPVKRSLLLWGVLSAGGGVLATLFGVASRARRSQYEEGAPVPAAPVDRLGRRVAGASRALQAWPVLVVAPFVALGIADPVDRGTGPPGLWVLGGAVVAGAVVGSSLLWGGGRDGVWATPTHLVARHRRALRRWRWDQVHELGLVVEDRRATRVAARVDDGEDDGIGADGWVTLARPLAGPLRAHRTAVQVRALAEEKGVPYTEGLTEYELADGMMGRLSRLTAGPPRRRA